MGKGTTSVIKIIAPIALEALATAAEALLAGGFVKLTEQQHTKIKRMNVGDWSNTIFDDTKAYIETKFADEFGYYFNGLQSQPLVGGLPVAAGEDIMVYDQGNGINDIQAYMQVVFTNTITPSDSINLSQNLSQLFTDRFKEESLSWTPFFKRSSFSDGTVVDSYMVTSSARDANGNLAGVVTYCFVAYSKS